MTRSAQIVHMPDGSIQLTILHDRADVITVPISRRRALNWIAELAEYIRDTEPHGLDRVP